MATRKKKTEDAPVKAAEKPVEAVEETPVEEVKEEPKKATKAVQKATTGKVTTLLNFRIGAGKNYRNLSALPQLRTGQEVEILETDGEWYKIKIGPHIGYAMAKYIR